MVQRSVSANIQSAPPDRTPHAPHVAAPERQVQGRVITLPLANRMERVRDEAIPAGISMGSFSEALLKRVMDLFLAFCILPFVVLVGIPVALLVMLDGGSPIFAHERVGCAGRVFKCLKFRSMRMNAQDRLASLLAADPSANKEWEETFKLKNDPRVTWIGKFLRRTSLDELPQLWNVICGDMSFVGPRPVTHEELERYKQHADLYLACKPGITGLWQIAGRNDVDYENRVALDAEYALSRSFSLDARILLLTIPVVLVGRGAY